MGDGAGVGKGRTIAGLILENWHRGRKKAMWFSASNDLCTCLLYVCLVSFPSIHRRWPKYTLHAHTHHRTDEDAKRDLVDVGAGDIPTVSLKNAGGYDKKALAGFQVRLVGLVEMGDI